MYGYLSKDLFYSNACPEYLVLSCLAAYKKGDFEELKNWISLIEGGLKEMFTLEHIQFYSIIKAEYEYSHNHHKDALATLQQAVEI